MVNIKSLSKLYEYTNLDKTYGAYLVNIAGSNRIFVRNGDKLCTVSHFIDGAEISELNDSIKESFYDALDRLNIPAGGVNG